MISEQREKKEKLRRGAFYYPRIYLMIITQDIKSKMHYRADFYISTIGMLATNIAGFISFWLIFQSFPSINGWTYYEMLFLYAFSLLALTPVQLFFDNNWALRFNVYSGDFVKYCFRPLNLFFYYISETIDIKGAGQLVFGAGTLVYAWHHLGLEVSVQSMVLLIVALTSASLVMIAMMNAAAATCFWVINSGTVMIFLFRFKDYAKYPMTIYNIGFQIVFSILIPIGFIAYYPSLIYLRAQDVSILTYLSPIIAVLFYYGSYKFWMRGAMKYSGTGS